MSLQRWAGRFGALLLVTLAAAPSATPASARELQGAVVILLDTVRPDRLSPYGYSRSTTPTLERLAREGVVFEQAIASSPWTLPSAASLLSARWAGRSFVPGQQPHRLSHSLADSFRRAGFETAAFTEGAFVSRHFGFDRGFSVFEEEEGPVRYVPAGTVVPVGAAESEGSIERTFARARDWLAQVGDRRFLLLVHTYEAHTPYRGRHFAEGMDSGRLGASFEIEKVGQLMKGSLRLRPEEVRYVDALYDGGIWECDRRIAELVSHLEALALLERTLLVVTSDHGEAMGEHHPSFVAHHGHSLKDVLLRIPLIVVNPAERYPAKRVAEQVRIIDVLPTVAEVLRVPVKQEIDGKSLVPLMRGAGGGERAAFGGYTRHGPVRAFVRTSDYKYIEILAEGTSPLLTRPRPVQLYDLRKDPGERENIAAREPERVEGLARRLREHRKGAVQLSPRGGVPDEVLERLRSLGYTE